MLSTTTGTSCTCSSLSSVAPVLTVASRRALRGFVWSAAPRIAEVLAAVGGDPTEARASVAADGSIIVMTDWRGRPLTADELGDAAARIAVTLGMAAEVVRVADAWCSTDSTLEAAWRGGMVLPMPEGAPPVAVVAPAPGGGRRSRRRPRPRRRPAHRRRVRLRVRRAG